MRFVPWVIVLMAILTSPLIAQAAPSDDARIDALFATRSLTWAQASWLVGRAIGEFPEAITPEEAARQASAKGWGSAGTLAATPLRLDQYCQLLARAHDLPRGMLESLFPGPRYAYRELVFRKIVPGNKAPDQTVSGEEALIYLQNAQTWKEARP